MVNQGWHKKNEVNFGFVQTFHYLLCGLVWSTGKLKRFQHEPQRIFKLRVFSVRKQIDEDCGGGLGLGELGINPAGCY